MNVFSFVRSLTNIKFIKNKSLVRNYESLLGDKLKEFNWLAWWELAEIIKQIL